MIIRAPFCLHCQFAHHCYPDFNTFATLSTCLIFCTIFSSPSVMFYCFWSTLEVPIDILCAWLTVVKSSTEYWSPHHLIISKRSPHYTFSDMLFSLQCFLFSLDEIGFYPTKAPLCVSFPSCPDVIT